MELNRSNSNAIKPPTTVSMSIKSQTQDVRTANNANCNQQEPSKC